jgi:dolichol-phosphate mannosyltransferase
MMMPSPKIALSVILLPLVRESFPANGDECNPAGGRDIGHLADSMAQVSEPSTSPNISPAISLIIPTLNEAENLPLLIPRIATALDGRSYEILIVDDNSRDATPTVCAELARIYPLHLLTRTLPKDGLSGAVLYGMAQAHGETLVVMDADLQHPPERLHDLLAPLESQQADFVLGSRYVPGGSTGGKWSLFRKINSRIATILARPFAGQTHDPMSGFFALRRQTYQRAQRLTPLGYKIGLELMCKCRVKNVREIPIHFAERTHGQSKLNFKEQVRYAEHLSRLYDFTFPHFSPIAKFLIVTALSWLLGMGIARLLFATPLGHWRAVACSYAAVLAVEAIFHRRYIRTQREFIISKQPWTEFALIAIVEWMTCATAALWVAQRVIGPSGLEIVLLAYSAATVARYVLRKELMQDLRGLRRDLRKDELS